MNNASKDDIERESSGNASPVLHHSVEMEFVARDVAVPGETFVNARIRNSRSALTIDVKFCKVVECYHSTQHRIEVLEFPSTTAYAVAIELIAYLVSHADGKLKTSAAPKGRLEREIQEWVDSVRAQ